MSVYGGGESGQKHSSETLGAAAGLQALKISMGGSAGGEESHGAGGNSQAQLIGVAMKQASKLWEEQNGKGNVVSIESFFYRVLFSSWFALYHSILFNLLIYFNSSLHSFLKSSFQIFMFSFPFRSRPLPLFPALFTLSPLISIPILPHFTLFLILSSTLFPPSTFILSLILPFLNPLLLSLSSLFLFLGIFCSEGV